MLTNFISRFFNSTKEKKQDLKEFQDVILKNAELENRLLQNSVEIQILKKNIGDLQDNIAILTTSQQAIAEEISTIYEIIKSMISPHGSTSFEISYEDIPEDDEGNNNLN